MDKVWTKIYCHFYFRGITLNNTIWGPHQEHSNKRVKKDTLLYGPRTSKTLICSAARTYIAHIWEYSQSKDIGLSVCCYQSSHLHNLHISQTEITPEVNKKNADIYKLQTALDAIQTTDTPYKLYITELNIWKQPKLLEKLLKSLSWLKLRGPQATTYRFRVVRDAV